MPNPFDQFDSQPARPSTIRVNPFDVAAEQRAQQDQAIAQQRLILAQQADARAASAADRVESREAREESQEAEERAAAERAQAAGIGDSLYQIRNVIRAARDAKQLAESGAGIGSYEGSQGFRDSAFYGLLGVNQSSNDLAALLNTIGSNTAFDRLQAMRESSPTGGALGAVSEIELRLLRDSIASLSQTQSEEQFARNLDRVIDSYTRVAGKLQAADQYYRDNGSMEGFTPPNEDELAALAAGANPPGDGGLPPPGAAGFGATETSVPIPPEYQEQYSQYIRENWGRLDPAALAQFRADLDRQFDFDSDIASYMADAEALNNYAGQGIQPEQVPGIAPANRQLSDAEILNNNIVANPVGAAAAGYFNAAGFGLPSILAGDQLEAIREEYPISSTVGEIGGGITGTLLGGAGLAGAAGRVANPTVAGVLANPLTADAAYGAVYGATQAEDPLYGAVLGGAAGAAGNLLGGQIARRVPGITGARRPADALNRGERLVAEQMGDRDAVAAALAQAEELGVPMTGADASPSLMSLAGTAIRSNPEVAGTARGVLQERNLGQLGRYRGAIERDLGPITNIPQRSDDLIQQARAAAEPLYSEAYSAPGASAVDISDLRSRPTFDQALREAYQEVADEGLDPNALGFTLNDAGEVALGETPSWQTLDYAKRGLDNIIERETDAINGISPAGRRAVAMKNDLLRRMDTANPAYAQARAAYAGPAAERSMMQQGQAAARLSPDQLEVDVANLSPAQREQMQLGFQSQLSANAGRLRNNSNPFGQIYNDDTARRLGALYPEESVANLLAQRDLETQLANNANSLVGNSLSAERRAADEAFRARTGMGGDITMGVAETAMTGGIPVLSILRGIGSRVMRNRAQAADDAMAEQAAAQIAPLLLNPNPAATRGALEDLAARDAIYQALLGDVINTAGVRGGHAGAGTLAVGNAMAQR